MHRAGVVVAILALASVALASADPSAGVPDVIINQAKGNGSQVEYLLLQAAQSVPSNVTLTAITPALIATGKTSTIVFTGDASFTAATVAAPRTDDWSISVGGVAATVTRVFSGHVVATISVPSTTTGSMGVSVTVTSQAVIIAESVQLQARASSPDVKITLKGSVDDFNENQFKVNIKELLGLQQTNQVYIVSTVPGSVVVTFYVLSTATQEASSSAVDKLKTLAADGTLEEKLGATALAIAGEEIDVKKPKSGSNAGAIAGAVIGSLAGVAIIVGGCLYLRRRRRQSFRFRGYTGGTVPPAFGSHRDEQV